MHLICKRGLDIPIKGKPIENPHIKASEIQIKELGKPRLISLNLDPFDQVRFKLLKKAGATVKIGEPILYDKSCPERLFVAPASGFIKEVRRGLKRRLIDIVIEVDEQENYHEFDTIDPKSASREKISKRLLESGCFAFIRKRPFNVLADPFKPPRSIFIKALESAPFQPQAELQIRGRENDFQTGITALCKLTDGPVHLICFKDTDCKAFIDAKDATVHTAEGPHPVANPSFHIHNIDPIQKPSCVIWTLNAAHVAEIGHLLNTGKVATERVISIAGPAVIEGRGGFFRARAGTAVETLIEERVPEELVRFISGEPLTGQRVSQDDFLGFYHNQISIILENTNREPLHFFRLGLHKYTFSKAYLSGHLNNKGREYDFTTSQHGEHRPFIASKLYDQVMPINVPTMQLVKAVMAEDYDLADELGLLEVDAEDFALPTFVDPSKMEMCEIIHKGLQEYAAETTD